MFSALMAVYAGERSAWFAEALQSLHQQSGNHISEVVLVEDGPLGRDLLHVADSFREVLPLHRVRLRRNQGLATALNEGLVQCSHEWVLRADSDDISLPQRSELQRAHLGEGPLDIVGGQIEEFDPVTGQVSGVRSVPCSADAIRRFAALRNPFNHMTVCFRRDLVLDLGGYPQVPFHEDYALWVRAIAAGARISNRPEVLVRARAGRGMYERRGGWRYVKAEAEMQRILIRCGFKSQAQGGLELLVRAGVFLAPARVRGWAYRRLLRGRPRD